MKVRKVMDCVFPICSVNESISCIYNKMKQSNYSYVVVVNDNNKYLGIVDALTLLKADDYYKSINKLIKKVTPILENEDLTNIRNILNLTIFENDIIPVINTEEIVTGVINLKALLEYLPEIIRIDNNSNLRTSKNEKSNSKYSIDDIIGQSRDILKLKERIIAAAKTKSTVLIMGETGTGKELVAHAIHKLSSRRHQPFIRINCAAIPENLLESELFGYEKGAFTGASKSGYPGKFQIADGGTIFLDEIGDMPISLQSKILRVLQEKEIERIGGHYPIPIDVRIIAATHRNLKEMVTANKFRKDLYYRLHVIPIEIAPLRHHPEDIPLLMERFLDIYVKEYNLNKPEVKKEFISTLMNYNWPGNVRELMNVLEMAVSLSNGVLSPEHIPNYIIDDNYISEKEDNILQTHTDEAEKEVILRILNKYNGNKIKASEALGISRSSLYNKMRKYKII